VSDQLIARQAEMLANRVQKAYRRLHARFERKHIGAYRLYDRDIPEVRAVVDWYEGHLVVGEYARTQTDAMPGWLPALGQACAQALDLPEGRVHLRRRRTRPAEGDRYGKLAAGESGRLVVRERDLRFWCDLDTYLDTGLFLDHRETRAMVQKEAAGKRVLNLYGYTASFTCAAAKGGAASSTTVDASRAYIAWARENLVLNAIDEARHELVRAEVDEHLTRAAQRRTTWDLIILDPPSFSDREGGFDVQADHRALIERCLRFLAPRGVLYFSTNHQRFQPQLEDLPARVEEITSQTVPEDFRNRTVHRAWRISAR
jgi:23S rRNA (cytosine1962-C5)-methyltransferase